VAAIPTRCSRPASSSTTRSSKGTAASRSASTSAAAITRACSTRRADTIESPRKVFSRARFHRFLLEYDDERSGTFEPLRHLPGDRTVRARARQLEDPAPRVGGPTCAGGIDDAARIVPLERLALSSQCGSPRRTRATGSPLRISARSWNWLQGPRRKCGDKQGKRLRPDRRQNNTRVRMNWFQKPSRTAWRTSARVSPRERSGDRGAPRASV